MSASKMVFTDFCSTVKSSELKVKVVELQMSCFNEKAKGKHKHLEAALCLSEEDGEEECGAKGAQVRRESESEPKAG